MRVAVIGAGISGIAAANILQKAGHDVVVFEKSSEIGGVWAQAYPDVRLQNIGLQYHLSDFPWPFTPDQHPTAPQILRYLHEAVEHLRIDIHLQHEVLAMEEQESGWLVIYKNSSGSHKASFDYVIAAAGQYTDGKHRPKFEGEDLFKGRVVTERDIASLDVFAGKRVLVVGFGKSAVDMATFAAPLATEIHHVFRTPRWLVPFKILGLHYSYVLFNRLSTVMMTSWAHPTTTERFLHERLDFVVSSFWTLITSILRLQAGLHGWGRDREARRRLQTVLPSHDLLPDLRSAAALAPFDYYRFVATGRIRPHHLEVSGFSQDVVRLGQETAIPCDLVVLSVGNQSPSFPFMPTRYRQLLESEEDGVQLYRHLIHPRIPRFAFAGFNHGFMHVPTVEVSMLWLCAHLRGDLELPSIETMEACIEHIRGWKRAHIHFEPSRGCAVNTRFQQYLDILLQDLGLTPYRKLPMYSRKCSVGTVCRITKGFLKNTIGSGKIARRLLAPYLYVHDGFGLIYRVLHMQAH